MSNSDHKQPSSWDLLDSNSELTEFAREVYELPSEAQVCNNLVSMANFLPLLHTIIDETPVSAICEIGAETGYTTNFLASIAERKKAKLYVVDPAAPAQWDEEFGSHVTVFRQTSLEFLERGLDADIFFIDGDHNYFTVKSELDKIIGNHDPAQPLLIFLDDVGWPWGRRDMYYCPETIPEEQRKPSRQAMRLFPTSITPVDTGVPVENLHIVEQEGGEANGVLSAVEAVIRQHPRIKHTKTCLLFGFGVLWFDTALPDAVKESLRTLDSHFKALQPLLGTLELNRITLLAKINQVERHAASLQLDISKLGEDKQLADKHALGLKQALDSCLDDRATLQAYTEELKASLSASLADKQTLETYTEELKTAISSISDDKVKLEAYAEELKSALDQVYKQENDQQ